MDLFIVLFMNRIIHNVIVLMYLSTVKILKIPKHFGRFMMTTSTIIMAGTNKVYVNLIMIHNYTYEK